MKNIIFHTIIIAFFIASCGKKTINYKEKLEGIWQITNVADLLKIAGDDISYNAESIRNATLAFEPNGTLIANIGKLQQKGKWSVAKNGTTIMMKADGLKFDETLPLEFENERTIIISNTGKKFVLKKIKD